MMVKTKKALSVFFLILLCASSIITQSSCTAKSETPVSLDGFYFDTVCTIAIYDMENMDQETALSVIEKAFSECAYYESLFSKTMEGTDVYRINHAHGEFVECADATIEVLQTALDYCALSGGAFDITIGKAADLWDFHEEDPSSVPSDDALKEAVSHIDYTVVETDGRRVRLTDPEAEIDLGGIAKGYIDDRLCEFLKEQGVTSALISLGGNISAVGDKNGSPFQVGLKKPFAGVSDIVGVTPCSNGTVVSSGVYERYFRIDDTLYHHILSPETGKPADTDIYGVTVTSDNAHSADCDALATICLLYGREKALDLIESMDGFEAYIIDSSEQTYMTSGFRLES